MRILATAIGDPLASSTWSGTTSRVCQALVLGGATVETLDARGSLPGSAALFGLHQLRRLSAPGAAGTVRRAAKTYWRSDYNWSPPARAVRGRRVLTAALAGQHSRVLHFGSGTGPLPMTSGGAVRQFLLCDSTWSQLSRVAAAERMSGAQRRRIRDAELRMLTAMEKVFVVGEHVRNELLQTGVLTSDRIVVVGTGFNMAPYYGPKDYCSGHLLFTAKARWDEKGGDLLLKAFEIVRQRNASVRLVIVGQDDKADELRGLAGVTSFGFMPYEKLTRLFAEASLFVMPALCEPWGLVYLEALASRTPIVGLDRFAFPEISGAGSFGFACSDPDPARLADTILEALSNTERLERMGHAGQQVVLERYSWERVAATMLRDMS